MDYSKEIKQAVAEQIIAMIDNNILNENGPEQFQGWCDRGEVFEYSQFNDGSCNSKQFVSGCTELMLEISPIVDQLTALLSE